MNESCFFIERVEGLLSVGIIILNLFDLVLSLSFIQISNFYVYIKSTYVEKNIDLILYKNKTCTFFYSVSYFLGAIESFPIQCDFQSTRKPQKNQ